MGIMSFIRNKPRVLASGEIKNYYYEVENYWKDGETKQRVIKYLGTKPYPTTFDLDHETATKVTQIILEKDITPAKVKEQLESIGIPIPQDEVNEVQLVFKPPHGMYTLHFD